MHNNSYKLKKFFEFKEADLEPVKSFRIQENLNPDVWDSDDKMSEDVKASLEEIGETFYTSSDIKAPIKDIILCGSLANYNWHKKYSDFDVHIIIDMDDVSEDTDLAEKHTDLAKKYWNITHDITVNGYDVEVAIQDESDLISAIETGRMGGVYSLKDDKWLKVPEKAEHTPDEKLISSKGKNLMLHIDRIEEELDENTYEENDKRLKAIWKKIKNYRKDGLEEEGEYSVGNLVFKLLRRNGYIEKVVELKKNLFKEKFEKK
jgi:hypothetical protein